MSEYTRIPLNDVHEKLGGKMIPFAGFMMPVRYSSDIEEHNAVRNDVGIFDVSHMGEFIIKGAGALNLIQKISANDAAVLEIGKAQYSYLPNESGGIVDDLLIYRLAKEEYMLVVNASNIKKDWDHIQQYRTGQVEIVDHSSDYCLFAIQGPKAIDALQKLTNRALKELRYYTFVNESFAGAQNVIISATGYTGSGGFELYIQKEDAMDVWNQILEAGEEFGILPIGLGARDTLRLEMGYCLYGNDLNDHTSPIEAGLSWVTKFTKAFVNSENLHAEKTSGVNQKLVGIEMIDRGIPRAKYLVCDTDGNEIGEITSGSLSPVLRKGIAMGYIKKPFHKIGTEVSIKVRNKMLKAKVVKPPFIKVGV